MKTGTIYLAYTHQGTRPENQDAWEARTIEENTAVRNMNRGELFMVADGMGGHRAGKEAAREACSRLGNDYFSHDIKISADNIPLLEATLENLFFKVNQDLHEKGKTHPDFAGWGCTVSLLLLLGDDYIFAHTGDTRIYRINEQGADLITEDHNVAFQMHLLGKTSYERYLDAPGYARLLSYMGMGEGISIVTGHGKLSKTDLFVLTSDGLNQFVQFKEMTSVAKEAWRDISDTDDPCSRVKKLYDHLRNDVVNPCQAADNVTFMVVGRRDDHESADTN